QPRPVVVLHARRRHDDRQHQPQCVHQQVALAARRLLSGVVAPRPSRLGGLHRLAVNNPHARPRLPTLGHPGLPPHGVVDSFPKSTLPPAVELRRDRSPRREVVGQHPPGAARPQDVEDAIKQVTLLDATGPPGFPKFPLRQQRPDELPLFVREIAGIGLPLAHAGIIPVWSIANSLSVALYIALPENQQNLRFYWCNVKASQLVPFKSLEKIAELQGIVMNEDSNVPAIDRMLKRKR